MKIEQRINEIEKAELNTTEFNALLEQRQGIYNSIKNGKTTLISITTDTGMTQKDTYNAIFYLHKQLYKTTINTTNNTTNNTNSTIVKKTKYIARTMPGGLTDEESCLRAYQNRITTSIGGPTGSGKTHLLRHLALKLNVPYRRTNLNGQTTAEDLVGQLIPNPNPEGKSKYVWNDGVLTKFMREGGIFVLDEINMAPADILAILNPVLDEEQTLILTQHNGEVVKAHPDFWCVATFNPEYAGTQEMNKSLLSRFKVKLTLGYNEKIEEKLGISPKMIDVAKKLRKSEEIDSPVSTRELLAYKQNIDVFGEKTARVYFVNNFEKHEVQIVTEILTLILDSDTSTDNAEIIKTDEN